MSGRFDWRASKRSLDSIQHHLDQAYRARERVEVCLADLDDDELELVARRAVAERALVAAQQVCGQLAKVTRLLGTVVADASSEPVLEATKDRRILNQRKFDLENRLAALTKAEAARAGLDEARDYTLETVVDAIESVKALETSLKTEMARQQLAAWRQQVETLVQGLRVP